VLERHLAIGLSALKTACCNKPDEERDDRICPICSKNVSVLSGGIPMLTKEASMLKCRINQSIMDEKNYPVALPNGHIYSISGLSQTEREGCYYCPITNTSYVKSSAKKVFLA
jgi:macrophage erythroblast attacher